MRLLKSLAAVTMTATLALIGLAAISVPAQADIISQCYGTKIESHKMHSYDEGKSGTRGHVELWYSPKDGGTNCVMTYRDGGGRSFTAAYLGVEGRGSTAKNPTYDEGFYTYYAGGVRFTDTNHKCVSWGGIAQYERADHNGVDSYEWHSKLHVHCG